MPHLNNAMNRQPDPFARVPALAMFALVAAFCIVPVALHTGCCTAYKQEAVAPAPKPAPPKAAPKAPAKKPAAKPHAPAK